MLATKSLPASFKSAMSGISSVHCGGSQSTDGGESSPMVMVAIQTLTIGTQKSRCAALISVVVFVVATDAVCAQQQADWGAELASVTQGQSLKRHCAQQNTILLDDCV